MPQNNESGIQYEETMHEVNAAYDERRVDTTPIPVTPERSMTPEQQLDYMSIYTKDLGDLRARAIAGLVGREDMELVA